MTDIGPPLETLLHRLAECPPEFLEPPVIGRGDGPHVLAIVCDHLRAIAPDDPPDGQVRLLVPIKSAGKPQQQFVALACWLLHDDWFLGRAELAGGMWRLFGSSRLATLSTLVKPQSAVQDADRREEFVRLCLAELGLRPAGEGRDQAADRLTTLDSAARTRVLRQTAAAERRAREIREAMAQKAAQESASRYGE